MYANLFISKSIIPVKKFMDLMLSNIFTDSPLRLAAQQAKFLSFGLRGPSPQAFPSFGRVGFIARHLRRPQKGNTDGAEGIFGNCRMRVGYGPAPGPTIKRPCAILARSVGRATNTASRPFGWAV